MKKNLILGLALISAIAFVSCKSSESSYRKAYEKAQAAEQTVQQSVAPVVQQPAAPVVTAPVAQQPEENVTVRQESLNAINGTLKAYNVICGSFKSLDNANRLCSTLKSSGYAAQVAQNPETGMYRVVAESFDDKSSAVNTRNRLRSIYPDAWLLLRK